MTLHCGKGMNEMERAICGMIHTSGFMSVSPVPFPSLNSLPSFIRPSLTPLWGLNYAVIQRLASPHCHAACPPAELLGPVDPSPDLTKSIEAEIARSVVVADDVVCLCYVTMRMIPLQQRRKSRPLEAGQSMITYRICGHRCSLQERIEAPLLDALLIMSRDPLLRPRAHHSLLAAIRQLFIGG